MATSSALSNILPVPFGRGLVLRPVEHLLEHPRHRHHERRADERQLLLQLGRPVANASFTPHSMQTNAMALVSVCANGRNTSVVSSSVSIERTAPRFCATFVHRLPWVWMQPFGRPVVPDV